MIFSTAVSAAFCSVFTAKNSLISISSPPAPQGPSSISFATSYPLQNGEGKENGKERGREMGGERERERGRERGKGKKKGNGKGKGERNWKGSWEGRNSLNFSRMEE